MNALYGNNIVRCIEYFGDDFYTNLMREDTDHFWIDVFLSWQFVCQRQYKMENVDTELFKMPILLNTFIKVNKKVFLLKMGTNKVLKSLDIFFDADGNLLAKQDLSINSISRKYVFFSMRVTVVLLRNVLEIVTLIWTSMMQVIHISPFIFHAYWKIRKSVKKSIVFWILKFIVLLPSRNGRLYSKMILWIGNQFSWLTLF